MQSVFAFDLLRPDAVVKQMSVGSQLDPTLTLQRQQTKWWLRTLTIKFDRLSICKIVITIKPGLTITSFQCSSQTVPVANRAKC